VCSSLPCVNIGVQIKLGKKQGAAYTWTSHTDLTQFFAKDMRNALAITVDRKQL